MQAQASYRILLIDDNPEIHRDYRKILAPADAGSQQAVGALEEALFDDEPETGAALAPAASYELDSAHQGQEALGLAQAALAAHRPYALALVDMRMPPGWDGVETIQKLWEVDPDLQVVVCTAYADYSWTEMVARLGRTDRLLILKKPFDAIEVCQIAAAMTEKWSVTQRERQRLKEAVTAAQEARAYAASLETVNRALEQAKAAAEEAARERSQFLVRLTGGILGPMADLVEVAARIQGQSASDPGWLELVEDLCRDGRALSSSLQDVLDLSALDAGTLSLEISRFGPLEAAEAVAAELRPRAAHKGLELELVAGPDLPEALESDRALLERVLRHLVDNAITYTERGVVRIGAAGVAKVPGRVVFAVEDTGPGFPPEVRARLFEPFCHAAARTPDARAGAGIGLFASQRLARALGGSLAVVDRPGGARLELTLDGAPARARAR